MIDKIINEWTYQLDAGYPTKESDYEILRSVLQETNMLSEQEIDRTILQAKGVNEDEEDELESDLTFDGDDVNIPSTFYSFEELFIYNSEYIMNKSGHFSLLWGCRC